MTQDQKGMNGMNDIEQKKELAPVMRLNSGDDLPVVGLGTYALYGKAGTNAVISAVKSGYRLIDTTSFYGNEREVGEGIRKSGIAREAIFVQTKLYPDQYDHAAKAIDEALEKLNIGYIDMMLLHHSAQMIQRHTAPSKKPCGRARCAMLAFLVIISRKRILSCPKYP